MNFSSASLAYAYHHDYFGVLDQVVAEFDAVGEIAGSARMPARSSRRMSARLAAPTKWDGICTSANTRLTISSVAAGCVSTAQYAPGISPCFKDSSQSFSRPAASFAFEEREIAVRWRPCGALGHPTHPVRNRDDRRAILRPLRSGPAAQAAARRMPPVSPRSRTYGSA